MEEEIYFDGIPPLSVDLIKELARNIPVLRVSPSDPIAKIMFKAGARELVETLLERLEQTNAIMIKGDQ